MRRLFYPVLIALCLALLTAGCSGALPSETSATGSDLQAITGTSNPKPFADVQNPNPDIIGAELWEQIQQGSADSLLLVRITLKYPTEDEKNGIISDEGKSLADYENELRGLGENETARRESLISRISDLYRAHFPERLNQIKENFGLTREFAGFDIDYWWFTANAKAVNLINIAAYTADEGITGIYAYSYDSVLPT